MACGRTHADGFPCIKARGSHLADLDDIYSARILELAGGISRIGRLASPDASATAHSKLCGSTVTIDITVTDGRVQDYAQVVKACLLGQAACSVMARQIVGCDSAELRTVAATMRAMLKEHGSPPQGRWSDLAVLQPVKDYKGRHASVMLVFDAVESALRQIETQRAAAQPASA